MQNACHQAAGVEVLLERFLVESFSAHLREDAPDSDESLQVQ
jgi:hypothetical protein